MPSSPPHSLISPLLLRSFADCVDPVFFVEIGANDGSSFDPLSAYLPRPGWRGLMVEPLPHLFARLEREHGANPRIELANVAVGGEDGERLLHFVDPAAEHPGLPPWKDQIASFDRGHLRREIATLSDREAEPLLRSTPVPCLSFESLCRAHGVERIDLLLVDTEGADWEIVGSVDFDRHRPRLLIFEHHHLSAEAKAESRSKLGRLGYTLLEEGLDTWCLDTVPEDRLSERWRRAAGSRPPA
jgi:FkbM family methyltransferase